jgi:serralysin
VLALQFGGAGHDTLVGLGGADRFAYAAAGNMGADTIIDFTDGTDLIELAGRGYIAGNLGGAITLAAQGGSTLITFASGSLAGTTLILAGLGVGSVGAADFMFV